MTKYDDESERIVRVKALVDEWARSGLLDQAAHARIAPTLQVSLRRTNAFLRVTLFAFGLLIVGAGVALVAVTFEVQSALAGGALCLAAGAGCAVLAEFLIARFRLYRFGVEEAAVTAAALLVAVGSGLVASPVSGRSDDPQLIVALVAGTIAWFAVYVRFGYLYAAVLAMVCASLVPFQLDLPEATTRLLSASLLGGCFNVARVKRRAPGSEFPGDGYASIQALAWLGLYALLNLQLFSSVAPSARQSAFYWFTYVAVWLLPAIGLWVGIRDRNRALIDVSVALALATLVTNKPYLGLEHQSWDPILFGGFLIGVAVSLRRWLERGEGGRRSGFTASRLLRSDNELLAQAGTASSAFGAVPMATPDSPSSDSFKGGQSGGAGGGASF